MPSKLSKLNCLETVKKRNENQNVKKNKNSNFQKKVFVVVASKLLSH
jgi:hypothetical protein